MVFTIDQIDVTDFREEGEEYTGPLKITMAESKDEYQPNQFIVKEIMKVFEETYDFKMEWIANENRIYFTTDYKTLRTKHGFDIEKIQDSVKLMRNEKKVTLKELFPTTTTTTPPPTPPTPKPVIENSGIKSNNVNNLSLYILMKTANLWTQKYIFMTLYVFIKVCLEQSYIKCISQF